MRFHKIAGILLLLSCCGWASIILPTDSSFETPDVSVVLCGPSGFDGCGYRPTGYGWFFTGSSGIASNGGVFGLDSPGNDNPAPDGNQAAFLQFDPSNPASFPGDISQTVTWFPSRLRRALMLSPVRPFLGESRISMFYGTAARLATSSQH